MARPGISRAVNLVQDYYLPMPEAQVLQGMETVTPSITDTNFFMVTSILTTGDGTVIYYDQWEDGYETNLANPTQPSTQVWGDGNDANGICPGFLHDPVGIPAGTVISLTNTVPCKPRNPSQVYYDGSDHLAANKAIVVTRAGWPSPTGPVDGGAVVVLSTLDFGTNFISPIGQDMPENLFKYVGFYVMAEQDNTTVTIDLDGPGPLPSTTVTLNQGQSYFVNGGVKRGGTITTSKPAEVNLACGDTVNSYAYDWFTLYPQSEWASTYYTPVPSIVSGGTTYTTINYFYNANGNPITILYTNLQSSGTFTVPANGETEYPMPTNSGASFTSADGSPFTVLTTAMADPSNTPTSSTDTSYNWGYTPLPKTSLTTVANVGWAPGSSTYAVNGSPVWVTPVANTTLYVAFQGTNSNPLTDPAGGSYATNITVSALQSVRIYNPSTNNDQTGTRVYTLDGTLLSVAWGEDAATAPSGNPGLDLGTSVLPFPVPLLKKSAVIVTDAPPAGLSAGDTIQYTVETDNRSLLPLGNTLIIDAPSASLQYVSNSTTLNGYPIPDTTNGFPLQSPGYTIPVILSQGTSVFQYMAKVVGSGGVSNTVVIGGTSITATNYLPPGYGSPNPAVSVYKSIVSPLSGSVVVGQTVEFNVQVVDSGNTILPNLSLADNFPTNLTFVSASIPANLTNSSAVTWTNLGSFLPGQATNISVFFTANATNSQTLTNSAMASSVGGATNTGIVTFKVPGYPAPGLSLTKVIMSPVNGQASVGQTVQYDLLVQNTGTTTLTNLTLSDYYPGTNFSFVTAGLLVNTTNTGILTWTNIGTYVPGQYTNISVSFLVTNYTAKLTNFMVASSSGAITNTNNVVLKLTSGSLVITKSILTPTNTSSVGLGSNIVFQILVHNAGNIPVATIPFSDTYSASVLNYVSATMPPSSTGAGNLYWTNLAGATPLPVNATITNNITMKVIGGPVSALNTATAIYAVDTNGNPVSVSPGSASINVSAAEITGTIYSDINQSGVYTNGDQPLKDVGLSLYSASNGIPVSLVESITSDGSGNYSLPDLSTGAYVLVESLLPGYAGSAPLYNSVLVNLSASTVTNINFFQYTVDPTNLASVNGTAWNDASGSGVYRAGDAGIANVEIDLLQDLSTNGMYQLGDPLVESTFTGTNGVYQLGGVIPGAYIVREIVPSNYVASSSSQLGRMVGSSVTTNGNDFFDYHIGTLFTNSPPVAVPDFAVTMVNVPVTIQPLANDISPGGFALTITNTSATNGIAGIIGGTNILFTPVVNFSGTATIGYTETNLNGSSTSLITVTVTPEADLAITKTAPASVAVVSNLTYTITVTNLGPSTSSGVLVTDSLPAGVSFISASGSGTNTSGMVVWSLGSLTNGTSTNVTVTVQPSAAGTITNVATVGASTLDTNSVNNTAPPVTTTVLPAADLAIIKTAPASVAVISNLTYTITVTNAGPSAASSVTVTDALPAGVSYVGSGSSGVSNGGTVTWNLGTIAAGTFTNVTVTIQPGASGTITNTATVSSPTIDTNILNNLTPPVVTTVTPVADLAITKSAPGSVSVVSNLTYTITVTNLGPSAASAVTVTDALPAGVSYAGSSSSGVNTGGVVTWSLGTLAVHGVTNITVSVQPQASGSITNIATVGSPTQDTNTLNNASPPVTTSVTPASDIGVAKSGPAAVVFNTSFTYTITVTNGGPSASPGLSVTDNLPVGLVFVSATPPAVTNLLNQVIWTNLGNFAANASSNLMLTVISTARGNMTNTATGSGPNYDPVLTNNLSLPVVTAVTNVPPVANPDSYSISENTTNTLSPLLNDVVRTPGGILSLVSVNPTNGTASISGTNVIFVPTANFLGTATIGYTITDGAGGTDSTVITVTVTNVPPVANPDSYSISENTTSTLSPLVNDVVKTPGGSLSLVSVSPTNGITTTSGTNIIFTPNGNFIGTATIGYTITDGVGGTNSSLIIVTVTNVPPVANPDVYNISENTTNTLSPLANDVVRTPGGVLSLVSVSPTNGTASLNGTNVIFVPTANFLGTATIGYTITDGVGGTNSTVITVSVTNVPPAANPDAYGISENTTNTLSPLVNDVVKTPGGVLSLVSLSPTNGTATISGTNVVFVPTANFLGNATIGYTIMDGLGGTNSSIITVTVTNVPPVANPDIYSVSENTTNSLSPLVNDVLKTPGGALSLVSVSPTNGSASISGTNVIFVPTANFLGNATIGYTIADGVGGTNSTVITVTVTNVPPVASPDVYAISENTTNTLSPLVNDLLRTPGGVLSLVSVSPTNGTASISGTNVIFTPNNDFLGTATISYTITDGVGGTNSTVITVTVTNIPPVANPDAFSVSENTTNTLSPLVNDVLRTSGGVLSLVSVSPTNGIASISGTNVIFVPTANFLGTATIGYTITDGVGGTNSTLITLTVTNVPPVANPDGYSISENTTNTLSPLVNDVVKTSGGVLSLVGVSPTNGIASISGTNVIFIPNNDFLGTATIGYTITDGVGGTNSTVITVTVTNVPPVANPDSYSVTENTTNTLSPLVNDVVKTPGGELSLVSVSPTNGTASISGTNVIFVPTANFLGAATFGYTITDGVGGTNSTVVTVTVTNVPPVANPDVYSIAENTTNMLSPLVNDVVKTPGGVLSLVSVSPTNGTASISGTNVIFVPTANFLGTATIGYIITDGIGGTNSTVITMTVTNVPPVANPDVYSVAENTTNTLSPLVNDVVKTPGGVLSLVSVSPTNGAASISETNVIFNPNNDFLGVATIGYTITDGVGGTNSTVITVTVTNVPPVANPDSVGMAENTTNTLSPLVNDVVKTPGGVLSLVSVSPTNGTASINGTNVIFTPTTNFLGITTIGYTITDGIGGTNSSVITVTVTNDQPLAQGQSLTTPENVPLPITLTGLDVGAQPLTFVIVSSPTNGVLSLLNTNLGTVKYTPNNGYTGADAFAFRVSNGLFSSSNAAINLTVTPAADLAVSQSGPLTGVAGANLTYTITVTNLGPAGATNVLVTNRIAGGFTFVNASDAGMDASGTVQWSIPVLLAGASTNLTVIVYAAEGGTYTNIASGGSSVADLDATNNNGTLTNALVQTAVYASADVAVFKTGDTGVLAGAPVHYLIVVTNLGPSTATNVVAQDALPVGAALQAASGSYTLSNNILIWAAANLAGGAFTNFTVTLTAPEGGSLTNVASSTSPTPDPNPVDNNGSSSNSIVTTAVTPVADLAVGKTGPAATSLGTNFNYTISVTNFGPSPVARYFVTDSLPAGIAFISASPAAFTNASRQVIWTNLSNLAVNGTTNLTLSTVAVTRGPATNIATVGSPLYDPMVTNNASIPVVTAVTNRPPVAVPDFASTPRNVSVTVPVLANDYDPDGDPLTITGVTATNGLAVVSGTNIVFTPTTSFIGSGYAVYTITDGFGGTNSALVTITVTNRPPVANGQSVSVFANTSTNITLTGVDPDGYPLTYVIKSGPANGTISQLDTNNGTLTYIPNTNYFGADSFTFLVNDGTTGSPPATVNITVVAPVTADLAVFKTGPKSVGAGSNMVYTITVTNAGPQNATNVLVSYLLPAGYQFVSATPSGGSTNMNNVVTWPQFKLGAHARTSFTVTAVSAQGGVFTNVATATSDEFDPDPGNNDGQSTNSLAVTTVVPEADVAVYKTGATNVPAGGKINYTITATNNGPSSASNVVVVDSLPPGSTFLNASGSYSLSNNLVIWSGATLTNGDAITYSISLTAPVSGSFTNVAYSTSVTSDPNTANNNGSSAGSRVGTKTTPSADLVVLLLGPANVPQGSNFVYSLIVSNAGPSTSSNIVASDSLPVDLTFVSTTGGGKLTNGIITWPTVAKLPLDGTTNYSIVVNAPNAGVFTNVASAVAATYDPDPANNSGVLPVSQAQTSVTAAQFNVLAGSPVFNPQTGLYEETVVVTNTGTGTVAGFRLFVSGLTNGVVLYNATGTNGGTPYVDYDFPLDPGLSTSMILEFYDPTRGPFSSTLSVVPIIPQAPATSGTNNPVSISDVFVQTTTNGMRFILEFSSVPGTTYLILYTSDPTSPNWLVATPSIAANANITQWYDDGPPKTQSKPTMVGTRYYRVIKY